jgi:hypothetical protein
MEDTRVRGCEVQGPTWRHGSNPECEMVSPCSVNTMWCSAGSGRLAAGSPQACTGLFPWPHHTHTPPRNTPKHFEDADGRSKFRTVRRISWVLKIIFILGLGSCSRIKDLFRPRAFLHSLAYTNSYILLRHSHQRNRTLSLSSNSRLVSVYFRFRSYHVFCPRRLDGSCGHLSTRI